MPDQIDKWGAELDKFTPRLRKAIEETFRGLIGKTPKDDIAGLAIYCDHDGYWLNAAAETFAELDAKQAKKPEIGREYRWSPAEWSRNDLDVLSKRPLSDLMKEIQQHVERHDDDDVSTWDFLLIAWVVEVLGAMLRDGWFDEFDAGCVLVVDILDMDVALESRMEWINALNEPDNAEDYRRWRNGDYALGER